MASIRLNKKIPGAPAGAVGCRIQDPGAHGYRWWKTADFSHSVGTAHGAPPPPPIKVTILDSQGNTYFHFTLERNQKIYNLPTIWTSADS